VTYIEGAVVAGFAAHCIDRILARHLPALLADPRLTPAQRAELESVKADTRKAARRWEASTISADVSEETARPEMTARSEWIDTETAGILLGVTARRARQLAASGLGVKVSGTWLLDRSAVMEHRQGRQRHASERPDGGSPQAVRVVA
jgi:hypothetical protein